MLKSKKKGLSLFDTNSKIMALTHAVLTGIIISIMNGCGVLGYLINITLSILSVYALLSSLVFTVEVSEDEK